VPSGEIIATFGNDFIKTADNDTILRVNRHDTITGSGGSDRLIGGAELLAAEDS
jgi:hypothetical protein